MDRNGRSRPWSVGVWVCRSVTHDAWRGLRHL